MKEQQQADVERITALVREYWERGQDSEWYHRQLALLEAEIGSERVEWAREFYDEERTSQCQAAQDRWFESHYR